MDSIAAQTDETLYWSDVKKAQCVHRNRYDDLKLRIHVEFWSIGVMLRKQNRRRMNAKLFPRITSNDIICALKIRRIVLADFLEREISSSLAVYAVCQGKTFGKAAWIELYSFKILSPTD